MYGGYSESAEIAEKRQRIKAIVLDMYTLLNSGFWWDAIEGLLERAVSELAYEISGEKVPVRDLGEDIEDGA